MNSYNSIKQKILYSYWMCRWSSISNCFHKPYRNCDIRSLNNKCSPVFTIHHFYLELSYKKKQASVYRAYLQESWQPLFVIHMKFLINVHFYDSFLYCSHLSFRLLIKTNTAKGLITPFFIKE
jgi:hypothetical protein